MSPNRLENVEHVEVCLGRDQGQSTCIFLAIVLIRCKKIKDAHRLKTSIGEINEEKDKIECSIALTSKINFGLDSLNIKVYGHCCMSIDYLNNISFYNNKIIIENSAIHIMNFFIIGDLKGMFLLLCRKLCSSQHTL